MPKDLRQKFADHGLKMTPQRAAIYQAVNGSKVHPSIDQIYKIVRTKLPFVSFDTVYRALLSFAEAGMIKLAESYGGVKRFEPDTSQHHHFHCLKCQKILDFECSDYDQLTVPASLVKKFKVLNQRVVLEGLCQDCAKKINKKGGVIKKLN